jgi:hypothetical protein
MAQKNLGWITAKVFYIGPEIYFPFSPIEIIAHLKPISLVAES